MRVLVTYSSLTGNTKNVADAIYDGLVERKATNLPNEEMKAIEATILPIKEVEAIEVYDAILVGYWVDKGGPNKEAAEFMAKIKNKKVGIFATLGAYPDTEHGWNSLANGEKLVKEDNEVIGRFICQGPVDPRLLERFKNLPKDNPHAPNEASKRRHKIAALHPNETDLAAARNLFVERLTY